MTWPADPRTRAIASALYESIADRPFVSVHNGLPARYLAEDLPLTNPVDLLVSHDQGVQALLRGHGVRIEFSPVDGWQSDSSRRAFALLWDHLVTIRAQPWMSQYGDRLAAAAGLPPFRAGRDANDIYDEIAASMAAQPIHPRRVLAAAEFAMLYTSDDPAEDLEAHRILAEDPFWAARVAPTFSPDRYLQPERRGWRTDADLLAEVAAVDTGDLAGFLEALRRRRAVFIAQGASVAEHHASDVGVARLPTREAAELYRLARSGELLPDESTALQRHLLWEMGAMSADDGLVMALYPPSGFRAASDVAASDRGIASRVRPLLTDFGSSNGMQVWLFSIDVDTYMTEVVPLAAVQTAVTPVPPTRFADDPDHLRIARATAVRAVGSDRVLGLVDDMSGPFAMAERHGLARRLDAGALAELVVAGQLSESQAFSDLAAGLGRLTAGPRVGRAV